MTPLRNGRVYTSNWSSNNHSGRAFSDSLQKASPIPRTFAEFPFNRTWQEIVVHAQRLPGASRVALYGQGEESWLRFVYMGESFGIQDGGNRLTITADNSSCPDVILFAVQSHFSQLLSAHLRD
jgi:hypothetical protein